MWGAWPESGGLGVPALALELRAVWPQAKSTFFPCTSVSHLKIEEIGLAIASPIFMFACRRAFCLIK